MDKTYAIPSVIDFRWEQDGDYVRIDEWFNFIGKSVNKFLAHQGTQNAFKRFQNIMPEKLYKFVDIYADMPALEKAELSENESILFDDWKFKNYEGDEGDEEDEGDEGDEGDKKSANIETTEHAYVHKYVLPIVLMYLGNTELGVLTDEMCPSHLVISCKSSTLHVRVYDGWFNATLMAKGMSKDLDVFIREELPKYSSLGTLTQKMGMVKGSVEKDLWVAPSMLFPFLAWCDPVAFADFTGRYLLTGIKHPNTDVFKAMMSGE